MGWSLASQPREFVARTHLPANDTASPAARAFVRDALEDWSSPSMPAWKKISQRAVDDAALLVTELVTNAVLHAGTEIEVVCVLQASPKPSPDTPEEESGPVHVVVEVADQHPSRMVHKAKDAQHDWHGKGLRLVSARAESWGVTYRRTQKAVWFRVEAMREAAAPQAETSESGLHHELHIGEEQPPTELPDRESGFTEWVDRAGPSYLAEAGELLAGQLDEDMVAALAAQLLVPRLADWCGVWLTTEGGDMRLSRVWHADEQHIDVLRRALEASPPPARLGAKGQPWPWPAIPDGENRGGSALACSLTTGGRQYGVLLIGRAGAVQIAPGVARLAEDVARRVAQAIVTARQYTRQTTISRALQRKQLPASIATIPGVDTAVIYEPHGEDQTVGGDFYDIFPIGENRWSFLLGDVSGHDAEAMSVTGFARHLVRLLAREGHGVESLLSRLNSAMAEESAEAVQISGEQARPRFLSLLYGELETDPASAGARCSLASAGHPLPLLLSSSGTVRTAAHPQMLLGIDEDATYTTDSFDLALGETLLCVTDGVTERRSGARQLDDDDGLAEVLRDCVGLAARGVAERVRQAAHDFDTGPVDDDLAVLVLQAVPVPARARVQDPATAADWAGEPR